MTTKDLLRKIGITLFCFVTAFLCVLFFSQTLSPLYTIELCDSSVFKIMGQAILHGKIPYVDLFDHKGPMLYAIQTFGLWLIPGRNGLFILAVISLSISIACWYKSARLFTTPAKSIIAILLALQTYYFYAEYGNLSEDWNIPFISVAYYMILSILFKDTTPKFLLNGIIVGLCLSGSFLIRPNDAVAFIGAPVFGVIIWLIIEKRRQEIIQWISGIAIGFVSLSLIFIIWFAAHNALSALWYGLFKFNALYSTGLKGMLQQGFEMTKLRYLPFLITLAILGWKSSKPQITYILIPIIIAAYVLLGVNAYLHYWIAWVPILFFSYWLLTLAQPNKAISIIAICVFLSLPIFESRNWLQTPNEMYIGVKNNMNFVNPTLNLTKHLFTDIKPEDRDSIWSYNLTWTTSSVTINVLLVNKITPCNRVLLIYMAGLDPTLLKSMDITDYKPKYILFSREDSMPTTYSSRDSAYIGENYHIVKMCENPQLLLYERNVN
jgi:hypothetical protein